MPVSARFEGPVLRVVSSGEYTWGDVHSAVQGAMEGDGFVDGETVLQFDTSSTGASRSADELRDIAADLNRLAPRFGALLVLAADDLRYGLARMLAAYAEHLGTEILVFRSRDAADSWLRAHTGGGRRRSRVEPPESSR